jgi:hypothetical protein
MVLILGNFGKYLQTSEIWCLGRIDNISWTCFMENGRVLHGVQEEQNVQYIQENEGRLTGCVTSKT